MYKSISLGVIGLAGHNRVDQSPRVRGIHLIVTIHLNHSRNIQAQRIATTGEYRGSHATIGGAYEQVDARVLNGLYNARREVRTGVIDDNYVRDKLRYTLDSRSDVRRNFVRWDH